MTNEEIKVNFPINDFKYYSKHYELHQPLVPKGCQGCAFIERWDCEKAGRTKVCRDNDVIFSRKLTNYK